MQLHISIFLLSFAVILKCQDEENSQSFLESLNINIVECDSSSSSKKRKLSTLRTDIQPVCYPTVDNDQVHGSMAVENSCANQDEYVTNVHVVHIPQGFSIVNVLNFDKHNHVLDLSEFNFRRREDIPVTTDKKGNEVISLGKQSVVFVGAGEGIMKSLRPDQIRLGPQSEDLYARVQTLETANYSLVLLFLCVLAMLMFYLFHKRSRVQSRQYVVGSLPHSKGVTPIANENANEVSLSTSDNNQPNSVREGESGTVVLPPPLEADDGTISDVSDNERRIGLLDTHAHSLTAAINELIGDMVNRGITVFDATKEEHTNSLPQDVIGALVFGAQTKQAGQLRKTIREFYIRKGIDCTEDQIQVSHGPDKAMTQAIQACVRPGSKVVLPMPHGPEYLDLIRKTGAVPLSAPTFREDGYNLRPEVLKELLDTHQVSCLLLCNPSNLTGAVPSREQLISLATVLGSYPDVIVISDESYDRIVFDDCVHTCFATLPGMEERTITVTEPGKVFGMPGLCIGVSVSPPKIAKSIASLQASIASSESSIVEHAAIATYSEGATFWLQERVRELQRNRDLCVELLKAEPSLPILFNSPQSVHCLILDVSVFCGRRHLNAKGESVLIRDSATLSLELLRAYQVAVVPGVAFGMDDHIRLHFAVSEDVLREVIVRLKKFLGSLTE